jgi:hypothetical protein
MLMPEVYQGIYTYLGTDGRNHQINVLQVAAQNGYPSVIDPTIAKMMSDIQATEKHGSVSGFLPATTTAPYTRSMQWNFATSTETLYPTIRLDYQITNSVGWHGVWDQRHATTIGNPNYPGAPYPSNNYYKIDTPVTSNTVDWVITPHLVNNTMFGTQSNMEYFYYPADIRQWDIYGGRRINLPMQTPLIPNLLPYKRNAPVWQLTDDLTWIRDKHSIKMGAAFYRSSFYEQAYNVSNYTAGVYNYSFGVSANDPMNSIIQNNMPFLNTNGGDANNARSLYAQLVGRLTGMNTNLNVDENTHQYRPFSPLMHRFAFNTGGAYIQDSWRFAPNLTINFGLRWQLDGTIYNTNGIDSWTPNLWGPSPGPFQPGVLTGDLDPQLNIRKSVYSGDRLNAAPHLGFNWSPRGVGGLLGKVLGNEKTVIGGSYNITYYNEGMNTIANLQQSSPGTTQSITASAAIAANPGRYTLASPPPESAFVKTPASFSFPTPISRYPLNGGITWNHVNPNLRSPYVQAWNFRVQRELARGTVLEIRYIGNKATHVWHYQDMNEINTLENGFVREFINAQNNYAINHAAGVESFANLGRAGQVPLPIFQVAFGPNGANNPAIANSSGFGSSSYITALTQGNVNTLASALAATSTATRYCRLVGPNFPPCAALGYTVNNGYPMNFFQPNPYANSVMYQDHNGNTNYNGLQIELRRAMNHGLTLNAWYVWSHTLGNISNSDDQTSGSQWSTLRNGNLNYGPTPFDHRHAFTAYWTYQLPFGKGRWINVNNRVLNGVLANWTLSNTNQIISGGPGSFSGARLTVNQWAGSSVVFGNGLTMSDLLERVQTMRTGNYDSTCGCFRTNVADIIQANGSPNPAYLAPAQTPGVMGSRTWYTGKTSFSLNMALTKEFVIRERFKLGFWAQATNVLNHPFFGMGNLTTTGTNFGNITSASGTRTMLVRSYLNF